MTAPGEPTTDGQPTAAPFTSTPNAERYLLQADDLRRRQLRSAMLHGSTRMWRERRRIWPAALAGVVVVAVIIASIAVYGAFRRQQQIIEEQERARNPAPVPTRTVTPSPR
jgi:flagellar biosynthesis/type III secretory pathway M-ring protein FliF/YscJ